MRLLIVMLKEPIAGQVKTRLAADVGEKQAADYYKALVEILLKQLQGLQNCRIRFCHTPDDADDATRFWLLPEMNATASPNQNDLFFTHIEGTQESNLQEIDFRPQGGGSFEKRFHRAFQQGFDDGFQQVAIISSDCPECGARWINTAFSILEHSQKQLVIGTNNQGNPYLTMLPSSQSSFLEKLQQHKAETFSAIINLASKLHLDTETLPPLDSVVYLADWEKIRRSPFNATIKKILGEDLNTSVV